MIKKFALGFFLQCALYANGFANSIEKLQHKPFYLGVSGGYGSTTWQGLVPIKENQNSALKMSTPTRVTEGGGVWGGVVGLEFIPTFALEFNYLRYPNASISFDRLSIFSFRNQRQTQLTSKTETIDLKAKIMLPLFTSCTRIFSSVGIAGIHRKDMLVDNWRISPAFGIGINYPFSAHFLVELGANYTAGYGEAQLNPTEAYFPFLYSAVVRLIYYF